MADAACGNVTISGRVANNSGTGLPGVVIDTCGASVTTDSNGNWSRTVPSGTSYCARVSSGLPAGYSAIKGTSNNSCNTNASTYEYQIAGQNQYVNCGYADQRSWDLANDSNINFVVDYPPVCSCNSWTSGSCAAGGCTATQRQQTRTCNPANCQSQSQCVADASCTSCSCGAWTSGSCAAGGCTATQRQQTRTCSPANCLAQSQCVADASCTGGCSCGTWADIACGGPCPVTQMTQTRTCAPGGCAADWQCVNSAACGSPPDLSLAFQVNPWSGSAPLNSVMTATVGGSAVGTINYTAWWNCNNMCTTVAACQTACGAWDDKADGVVSNVRTLNHTYAAAGTYYAKMVVERQSLTTQGKVQVIVSAGPTLTASIAASPSTGAAPLATTLTSTLGGTATGNSNYTYWWNCNNACATVAACQTACGAFDSQQLNLAATTNSLSHTYAAAGSFTPKVIAERAGLSAESRATVTVSAPLTLMVALSAAPISGSAPLTTSLTATVSGTATGTINYTTWWNCNNACTTVAACQTACGAWDDKADGVVATTRNLNHTYAAVGTYTPKIIVERASLIAEDSATVDVTNGLPTASSLIKQIDYCGSGLATMFSWTYSDPENDPQTYRQVQVDNDGDFSSPVDDSGKIGTASPSYVTLASKLAYDTTYHWRLKVWDSNGNDSGWIAGSDFSTSQHAYPVIAFNWIPATPKEDTEITYTDQTQVFGGATVSARSWVIQGATPGTSVAEEVKVIYAVKGDFTTTLTITDSSGYTCSLQKAVKVKSGIPDWEEL